MAETLLACPACAAVEREFVDLANDFEIVRCHGCGLEYTNNPEADLDAYSRSYAGTGGILDDSRPYFSPATRLSLERDAFYRPTPHLTAAERWVLKNIDSHVPRGVPVLDIGCGTGRLLEVLRRRGYEPYGVEPTEELATTLRSMGYNVTSGKLPGLEWEGLAPAVVTLFEVLEHVPDPLAVLAELRERFPHAYVGISVPSPARVGLAVRERDATDYPPNHFLRWTAAALERCFSRAGYSHVEVVAPPPRGAEFMPGAANLPAPFLRRISGRAGGRVDNGQLRRPSRRRQISATGALATHAFWQATAEIAGRHRARKATQAGFSSTSLAAWAQPD